MTSPATPALRLPGERELAVSVAHVLRCEPSSVTVLSRDKNVLASTWPSEIVHCRVGRDSGLRLLIKHGPSGVRNAHGHPVGPEYEANVYETVLRAAGASHPFLGSRREPGSRSTCIVLEYLDGWLHLNQAEDPRTVVRAAAWVGAFHATATAGATTRAARLNRYDAEYYAGWARRSLRYLPYLADAFPWLEDACRKFEEVGARLAAGPVTVVHGELYPSNVLVHRGAIRPVDWEWAGLAAGEVDLAALTEGWSTELTQASERAYAETRWPRGAPADFAWRLDAARIYMHLRWLGGRTDRTKEPQLTTRMKALEAVARRLEMIADEGRR